MSPSDFFICGYFINILGRKILTTWEDVISYENLYRAHRRARLSKRHKKEVILFEANLSENLWALHYDLKYGRYNITEYHMFTIYDPKEREIQAISYRDRIVQHSLCDNYLTPLLERHLIYDNTACRVGKGSQFAINRFRKFLTMHYREYKRNGYFVKIDVKKYFASIDHNQIKQKLCKIVDDQKILTLLYKIIDSYNFDIGHGLPMGNQTSQCMALLYLNDMDRYFKEKCQIKYYVRYMDDILMIVPDKNMAKNILTKAKEMLELDKLIINPKSTMIPIKNGVQFLGWIFRLSSTGKVIQKIRKNTKTRIVKKVKLLNYNVKCHKKSEIDKINSWASYQGFLMRGMSNKFLNKLNGLLFS